MAPGNHVQKVESAKQPGAWSRPIQLYLAGMCPARDFPLESFWRDTAGLPSFLAACPPEGGRQSSTSDGYVHAPCWHRSRFVYVTSQHWKTIMIVRIRDLVSGLLMFPLALAGFALGFITVDIFSSGIDLTTIIGLLISLIIPGAYFFFIAKRMQAYPNYRYFGELSASAFLALAIAAYVLPLLAAVILLSLVF